MADTCECCGKPNRHDDSRWEPDKYCRRLFPEGSVAGCYHDGFDRVSAQLKAATELNARLEREVTAWNALHGFADDRGGEFGMQRCSDGTWYADYRDSDAEADTPGLAAIALAVKLGLLAAYDQARAEVPPKESE